MSLIAQARHWPVVRALKAVVSLLLVALLLTRVDRDLVVSYLARVNPFALLAAFAIFALQFPISTWKWQKSLQAHGLHYRFGPLLTILCIGFFFNSFLPTSIGGDGYRVVKTWPRDDRPSRALSAVLVERVLGFAVLVGLGLLGAVAVLPSVDSPLLSVYTWLGAIGGVLILVLFLSLKLGHLDRIWVAISRVKKLQPVTESLRYLQTRPREIRSVLLISVLFQVLAITAIHLLFRSLNVEVDFARCAVITAVSAVASVLPVSVNGLGVMEGSLVLTATQLGVDVHNAVIVAFMTRILVLPLTLVGGLLYASQARGWRPGR